MTTTINDLSSELMGIIFGYLKRPTITQIYLVSKFWMVLFIDRFWPSLKFKNEADLCMIACEIRIFDVCKFFYAYKCKKVYISDPIVLSDNILDLLPRLTNLEILHAQYNRQIVEIINRPNVSNIPMFPALKRIELDHANGYENVIKADFIKDLLTKTCGNCLESINIRQAWIFLSDDALLELLEYSPESLQTFELTINNSAEFLQLFFKKFSSQARQISVSGSYVIGENAIENLMFPNLATLELSCQYIKNTTLMKDDFLIWLSQTTPCLERLHLFGYDQITDIGLEAFIREHSNMKELELSKAIKITNRSLLSISEYCLKLERLKIETNELVTEVGLLAILKNCTKLRKLDIWWCPNIQPLFDVPYDAEQGKILSLERIFITKDLRVSSDWIREFKHIAPSIVFSL